MNSLKIMEAIKLILVELCRLMVSFRLKAKRFLPQKNKSILLVGTSEVTVDFLLSINEIMNDFGDMEIFLLVSKETWNFAQTKLTKHQEKITLISRFRALCSPWDLIIFADHSNTSWFHPGIAKIYSTHGIESGKTLGLNGNYNYGHHNTLDHQGNLLYDLMFIENSYYRDIFTQDNLALKGKLAVVGNLRADELIRLNQEREAICQQLGLQKKDRVLLICSTWGPDSLIQRFGTTLLKEISNISEMYKVYLLIHPLNDRVEFSDRSTILECLDVYERNGIARRVDPKESPLPYLVAADIVLSDHGSLSLYYGLLERPLLFVSFVTENLIIKESLIWKFYELQERYNPDMLLGDQLDCAIKNFPIEQHKKAAKLLIDEPGQAKQRIHDEIAKFL